MNDFSDISFWKQNYGLLPLNLKGDDQGKFLMLNGGYGDFCLQTSAGGGAELYKEYSWSSSTKNYLVVQDENIRIVNWLDSESEIVSKSAIESNLGRFYKYLLSKSYKTENDAVPFIIDIFKQLRNETSERENPKNAISLLFQLLMSLESENVDKPSKMFVDFEKAQLPSNFEYYLNRLRSGVKSIKPNLDLILRHSSGALFQEAHKEVLYFDLQRDLFGGLPSSQVSKNDTYSSIHYTPPYLARSIVENSLKEIDLTRPSLQILDPSCGSSEFLIEVLKQLKFLDYKGKIKIIGFDSSISAIETSKFLLHYENQSQWNGNVELQLKLVEDSLTVDWGTTNDLVLMNPPFVSWEQLKKKESRDLLKDILGDSFTKGRPNQASAFFRKATQALNEKGVLGCVIPSSIFTFNSYRNLRNEIEENVDLKLLAKLGNYVFEDALADVSMFIGKKPQGNAYPRVIWSKNEKGVVPEALRELRKLQINNENAKLESNYNIYTPKVFPSLKDSWKLIPHKEESFIRDLGIYVEEKKLFKISSLFAINRGAILGIKGVFTITVEDYFKLPKSEKKHFRQSVSNDSINEGRLDVLEYVWYPYDTNGLTISTENEALEISFVKDRLLPYKDRLLKRVGNKNWWELTRPINSQFEFKPSIFSSRFGNSKSFALEFLKSSVVVEGNAIVPKSKFCEDDFYFYLAVFSSSTFDTLLSIYAKQLAGGKWYDLGSNYLKNIPIPNIKIINKEESSYFKLVKLARELEAGNSSATYSINDLIKEFYPEV